MDMVTKLSQVNPGYLMHLGGNAVVSHELYDYLKRALPRSSLDTDHSIYREGDGSEFVVEEKQGNCQLRLLKGTLITETGDYMCVIRRMPGKDTGYRLQEILSFGDRTRRNAVPPGTRVHSLTELNQVTGIAFSQR